MLIANIMFATFVLVMFGPTDPCDLLHRHPRLLDVSSRAIHRVVFNRKQDHVAVLNLEKNWVIRVHEFPSMRRKAEFKLPHGFFSVMALSPCGRYLAVNGNGLHDAPLINVMDLQANPPKLAKGLVPLTPLRRDENDGVTSAYDIQFSDDGEGLVAFDSRILVSFWKWRSDARAQWEVDLVPRVFRGVRVLNYDTLIGTTNDGVRWLLKREEKSVELSVALTVSHEDPVLEFWTAELKTAVIGYRQAGIVEIHDLAGKGRSRAISAVDYGKILQAQENKVEFAHAAVSRDRSVVMVSYSDAESAASVAFFPCTPERYKEFGLDPATQTHLVLTIPGRAGRATEPPGIVFSPDGRWFVFQGCPAAEPRFWDMNNLGRQLLAEKAIVKR